ncbi:transcriptional regulator [Prauserella marina]|nr:transcriptional regulator [Prauserella marina]
MKTVDKGGIHLEQCDGCRGIFLDHGELEQIVRAENAFYGAPAAGPPPYRPSGGVPPTAQYGGGYRDSPRPHRGGGGYADSPRPYRGGGYGDSPRPYRGGGYGDSPRPYGGHGYGHGHKRRKRSFLENLFD